MGKKQATRNVDHPKPRQAQTADSKRFERMERARKRRQIQALEARMWREEVY